MQKVEVGAHPVRTYDPERSHEILSLMLDPRYCRGQTFQMAHADPDEAKTLWKRYTNDVLVPAAVQLYQNTRFEGQFAIDDDDNNGQPRQPRDAGICDDSDSDLDLDMDNREVRIKIETELRMFRKSKDLPEFASHTVSPLTWWADHSTLYPSIAELARIVLAVPGSQIECERIFSLAGLLTSQLRNRMSPENLGSLVFLSKNLDIDATLDELLGPTYGQKQWEVSKATIGHQSESIANEGELFSSMEGGVNWYVLESLLEDYDPLM